MSAREIGALIAGVGLILLGLLVVAGAPAMAGGGPAGPRPVPSTYGPPGPAGGAR